MSVHKEVGRTGAVTWRARVRLGDGSQRSRNFPTRKAAEAWEREHRGARDRGAEFDPSAGRGVTVEAWFARWYRGLPPTLSPNYRSLHDGNIRNHIVPVIGAARLSSVRPSDARRVLSTASERLANNSVRRIHETMRMAFEAAVDEGLIGASPMRKVNPPAPSDVPMRFLSVEELDRLAASIDPRFRALVMLLGYVGLRFGEAAGLRVSDLDLDRRRATIAGQVSADKLDGGRLKRRTTKTSTSQRQVGIPGHVVAELRSLVESRELGPHGAVFAMPKGGTLDASRFRSRFWVPAVERAGLGDLTPHELRHTAASLMIHAGNNVLVVARQLGHRDASVTLKVYGHLFEDRLDEVADSLERLAGQA